MYNSHSHDKSILNCTRPEREMFYMSNIITIEFHQKVCKYIYIFFFIHILNLRALNLIRACTYS